ncbi:hypothetical protein [Ancylobacter oerskovii]|uniref:Uncharacterized protein n=1 Tax=Ancylobacter oerskovii TaxID=459519 RepID=A0ABW4YXT0_9HYPH|nr:hypothetical protein [Ancylobacter oerskovii]MBS7542040.1 hypothetical protein [Ancylobacter oerskovii]
MKRPSRIGYIGAAIARQGTFGRTRSVERAVFGALGCRYTCGRMLKDDSKSKVLDAGRKQSYLKRVETHMAADPRSDLSSGRRCGGWLVDGYSVDLAEKNDP